jgi:adenine phosphoribosyltransferase
MSSADRVPVQLVSDAILRERIERSLRVVPDFPEPGIRFQDITPLLADASLFADVVNAMAAPWTGERITHVAGIESRGFILAGAIAVALRAGFIPIRKPGKLPWKSTALDYALEYGTGRLEMHVDACAEGSRVLIVDDVLATGGTASAVCALVESIGARVAGCTFLLALVTLNGASRLADRRVCTLVEC